MPVLSRDPGSRDEGPRAALHGDAREPGPGRGAAGSARSTPTDGTLSVQQGLALTLQPMPTLDLQTQPGPRMTRLPWGSRGSRTHLGAGTESPPQIPRGPHRTAKAARDQCLSGEWRSGTGRGGLQILAALKPCEEVSSQQRQALRSMCVAAREWGKEAIPSRVRVHTCAC